MSLQRGTRTPADGMMSTRRLPYIWDYDLDEQQLRQLPGGTLTLGSLNQRWAAVRLLEYAPTVRSSVSSASVGW